MLVDKFPGPDIPLKNKIFRNGQNFILRGELDIQQRLASNQPTFKRIILVKDTDSILREECDFAFIVAKSKVLEGAMGIQKCRTHSVYTPFLAVYQ